MRCEDPINRSAQRRDITPSLPFRNDIPFPVPLCVMLPGIRPFQRMPNLVNRLCVLPFLLAAMACSGSTTTAPTPAPTPAASPTPASSPTPSPTPPTTIVLTGRVTDSTTLAPISGATVSINGRYKTTTDGSGNYSVTGLLDPGGNHNFTYVSADNYASDYRYIRGTSQNVHLYRITRITAGDSTVVTIAPDDTLCVNNVQDTLGLGPDYVCRSVRVVAPSNGVMTVEALSNQAGAHPPLEVETVGAPSCCSERIENPTSIPVTGGTEVVVNVEMVVGSTSSQSFTLKTSMSPR